MKIKYGTTGPNALWAQQRLNANGFCLKEDGKYKAKSKAACKRFQRLHGLKADGVIAAKTQPVLASSEQPTRIATSWGKTGKKGLTQEIIAGGVIYPVYDQDHQTGVYADWMDDHGCSCCATASAAVKCGIELKPGELYKAAKKYVKPANAADDTLTTYGACLTLRHLGCTATWCGIEGNDAGRAAAAAVIRDALNAGRPVIITTGDTVDKLYNCGTVHTILLAGLDFDGNCIVGNSNKGGRVQVTTVEDVVRRAIFGSIDPAEMEFWFGKKRTSSGFCIVG